MSISAVMKTSTSGMNAQSNRLSAIADNIANANTTGYKRAYNEFSSFIPNRTTSEYVSGSVVTALRTAISEQGTFNYTTSQTDLAVNGKGFFLVANTDDEVYLTRAGSFVKDGDGDLMNAAGYYLMGYPYENGVPVAPVSNGTEGLERIQLADLVMEAELSDVGVLHVNVDADAHAIDPTETDPTYAYDRPSSNASPSTDIKYTSKTSVVVYANLGRQVTLDMYWTKTPNSNEWELTVFDHANYNTTSSPLENGFPYIDSVGTNVSPLVSETVTFSGTTGIISTPTSIDVPVPDGANPLTFDLSQCSQLAHTYTEVDVHVNGSGPSAVDSVEFTEEGVLYAVYENGARVAVYNIPLANVPSPDNLRTLPGDIFATSYNSGDILLGTPGNGGFGTLEGGALEQSTVDLAGELSDLIEAERHYQMNSKVFQTGADILEVIVNLKR